MKIIKELKCQTNLQISIFDWFLFFTISFINHSIHCILSDPNFVGSQNKIWRTNYTSQASLVGATIDRQLSLFCFENTSKRDVEISASTITAPRTTDTQRELFSKISNFWAWADILGWNCLRHLGYFRPNYQPPFWYCESLVHVFHYSTIISTNKP